MRDRPARGVARVYVLMIVRARREGVDAALIDVDPRRRVVARVHHRARGVFDATCAAIARARASRPSSRVADDAST